MLKNPKNFFFIVFHFAGILYFKAQAQKWELGIVGGAGIVSTRTTKLDYPKTFRGVGGGLSLKYQITPAIAVLANLFYEQKSFNPEVTTTNYQGTVTQHLPYQENYKHISLPIIFNLSLGKRTKFFVNAGMYFNYLLYHDLELSSAYFGGTNNQTLIIKDTDGKKYDAGAILGIGIAQPLSQIISLSLEFRNYVGLYNLSPVFSNEHFYMNYQTLLLGLNFKLGKSKSN